MTAKSPARAQVMGGREKRNFEWSRSSEKRRKGKGDLKKTNNKTKQFKARKG